MPALTEAARDLADPLERIARIAPLVEAAGDRNEALGRLVPEVVDALHAQRLFRLLLPRVYGGEEIDLVTWFRTLEALGKLDASTAWCVGQINGCAATASAVSAAVAHTIWDDPRAALSWGPPVKARAIQQPDGVHRVSGEWTMSSGSRHASWIGLMAPVFDAGGAPVALPHGAPTRVFFVPASEVEWIESWNVTGLRATNSGGFKVNDALVRPGFSTLHHHELGAEIAAPLYKFPLILIFAIGFSGVALGIARAMLDAVIALAISKKPRLSELALRESHLVQFQIGEAEARLRSARSYVETTTAQAWRSVIASGVLSPAQRMDIRLATTFAIHEAKAVAGSAWEISGANAIFAGGPLERRWRDINTVTQQLQGRKSHLQDVGAYLLGLGPR
jgi:alkylation response protein AidB-like acyl-CoA dehydrogenase